MPDLPRLVVVTGPPGAGKTTVAAALRARLGLPLIAKDALKETLGDALEFDGDRHESQRLGVATFHVQFAVVRELLAAGVSLIAEGNFRGSWFETLPPADIVQVYVSAAPGTLRERLLGRDSHRHPVHYDREAADEIAQRAAAGEWLPLAVGGRLIEIDTTSWPDLDEVLRAV
ncbi:MAG: AAA family ATPase [Gaiellaceae bacterium]